jgi:hypothetical protein
LQIVVRIVELFLAARAECAGEEPLAREIPMDSIVDIATDALKYALPEVSGDSFLVRRRSIRIRSRIGILL